MLDQALQALASSASSNSLYRRIAGWITRAASLKLAIVVSGPTHAMLEQSVAQEAFGLAELKQAKYEVLSL